MNQLHILSDLEFRYYLFARLVSSLGDWFQNLAFPFAIYQLTGSGSSVAIGLVLQSLPYVIILPFAGVLADRNHEKRS